MGWCNRIIIEQHKNLDTHCSLGCFHWRNCRLNTKQVMAFFFIYTFANISKLIHIHFFTQRINRYLHLQKSNSVGGTHSEPDLYSRGINWLSCSQSPWSLLFNTLVTGTEFCFMQMETPGSCIGARLDKQSRIFCQWPWQSEWFIVLPSLEPGS